VLIVAASVALIILRPERPSGEVSSPIIDPDVSQDVNTMLGQRAPAFNLPDASGVMLTVTPGQGRPLVIISHMGFY